MEKTIEDNIEYFSEVIEDIFGGSLDGLDIQIFDGYHARTIKYLTHFGLKVLIYVR